MKRFAGSIILAITLLLPSAFSYAAGSPQFSARTPASVQQSCEAIFAAEPANSLLGRTYSFDEAVSLVADALPDEMSAKFRGEAEKYLSGLKVQLSNRGPEKSGLKYRNRFFDWSIRRSRNAQIIWTGRTIETQDQLDKMIESTIDIVSEAAFIPVRRHSIYLDSVSKFNSENIEVMKDKILRKLFVLGEVTAEPEPGPWMSTYLGVKSIFQATLPIQFAAIRGLKLNQGHINAFKEGGPQKLYRYIRDRNGLTLAVRYWFNHLLNIKTAIVLAYVAIVAPSAYESWQYFAHLQSFQASSDAQYALASHLYDSLRMPPADVMNSIKSQMPNLSFDDQSILREALQMDN